MQEMKYSELENRASHSAELDAVRKLETRTRVHDEIERMRASGEALTLTDEEQRILWAFRRFKLRIRKNGEVFTWQTCKPEGVQLVTDSAEVILPQEL